MPLLTILNHKFIKLANPDKDGKIRWDSLYEHSPGYSFCLSIDGTLLICNNNFRMHLGLAANGDVKIENLLEIGSKIFYQTNLLPMVKLQGQASEIFLSFKTHANGTLPVLLNIALRNDNGVEQLHFAGISIAQRNKFEKEILEAKETAEKALLENSELVRLKVELENSHHTIEQQLRELSRVTALHQQLDKVLSHDLQEPLRKISFFASLIEMKGAGLDPNIQKILFSAARLSNLISRMQRLHALEHRKIKVRDTDLNQLIAKAKTKLAFDSDDLKIDMDHLLPFKADAELLTNVFEELLDNSLKFKMDGQPAIVKISIDHFVQNIFVQIENKYKYQKHVRITYQDNSTGFDNANSKLVFDLFKKLHTHEGLGIGLTYIKRIVELHQGSITVKSELNQGTVFTLLLPVA